MATKTPPKTFTTYHLPGDHYAIDAFGMTLPNPPTHHTSEVSLVAELAEYGIRLQHYAPVARGDERRLVTLWTRKGD